MGEGKGTPSKKRVAGTEISKDNPYPDDDSPEPEMGTFKRATEEVMANRRIVKVRRQQPQSSASNPFANISFAAPSNATEKTDDPVKHVQPVAEIHTFGDKKDTNNNGLEETKSKATKENDDPVEHVQLVDENPIIRGKDDTNNKSSNDLEEKVTEIEDNTVNYQGHIDSKIVVNNSSGELAPNTDKADESVVLLKGDDQKTIQERQEYEDKTTRNSEGKNIDETVKEVSEETKEAGKDTKTGEKNQDNDHKDKAEPTACFSSFKQLSSNQNAFTGVAGTGFSSMSFSFGSIQKDGPSFDFGSGSKIGQQKELSSFPAFGFGSTNNGSSSVQLFGSHASDTAQAGGSIPVMQGGVVETGEENEKVVFNADAVLFEYSNGGWKERGKGEVRVNVSTANKEKARLVMRARGNYRLILNSSIYPGMSLKDMDKRSIIFPCVNNSAEQKGDGLTTFALKFRESLIMEEFRSTVTKYIEKSCGSSAMLKTPENSPKASDD